MSGGEKTVIGIALTSDAICAAGPGIPASWRRDIELHGGSNGGREALSGALTEAKRAAGADAPIVAVALLAPLAELRAITLPPLAEDERNRFLARNAGRYFVSAKGLQVVGSQAAASSNGAPSSVLAAATAHQLITAVHAASAASGCVVRSVVPAESAWAAAALTIWPVIGRGTAYLAVVHDDHTDLLTLVGARLASVRRFRGRVDAAEIAEATGAGAGSARVAIVGARDGAAKLAAALTAGGAQVLSTPDRWTALTEQPDALAAHFAAQADSLLIRTDETREEDRGAQRVAVWSVVAATVVTLLVAGGVYYRGVQHELATVRDARAAIRPQVEATLVGRSSVDAAYRQLAALSAAAREAPRWSLLLASMAAVLRDDASLTAFRSRGDSVFVDGVAERAAPVFDDMARVPGIAGVRATAPVRREAVEGETPLEHFSLGAQLLKAKR